VDAWPAEDTIAVSPGAVTPASEKRRGTILILLQSMTKLLDHNQLTINYDTVSRRASAAASSP
jgi:hypothetical protein